VTDSVGGKPEAQDTTFVVLGDVVTSIVRHVAQSVLVADSSRRNNNSFRENQQYSDIVGQVDKTSTTTT